MYNLIICDNNYANVIFFKSKIKPIRFMYEIYYIKNIIVTEASYYALIN